MLLQNKDFNKQKLGIKQETIQKPLKDISKLMLKILGILKCLNKFGEELFNWPSLMKKTRRSKSLKLSVESFARSEHLIAPVNFLNKSIFLKKLLEPIARVEIMKLPKTAQE